MTITMTEIADNPKLATNEVVIKNGEKVVFRPLEPSDISKLADFLQGLSLETRRCKYTKWCQNSMRQNRQRYWGQIHCFSLVYSHYRY